MLEIRTRLKVKSATYNIKIGGRLRGPLAHRSNSAALGKLESGEEVKVNLSEGGVLHDGDLCVASDGRIIQVEAAPETVVQASFSDRAALARAAFYLGSEHVHAQIGDGVLCIAPNEEAEKTLVKLGARLSRTEAVLEPDPQTYAVSHAHHHHDHGHDHHHHGHDHGHDHKHDHGHKHDHKHGHEHTAEHQAEHKAEHQAEHKHDAGHDHEHHEHHEHHKHDHVHKHEHKHK